MENKEKKGIRLYWDRGAEILETLTNMQAGVLLTALLHTARGLPLPLSDMDEQVKDAYEEMMTWQDWGQ